MFFDGLFEEWFEEEPVLEDASPEWYADVVSEDIGETRIGLPLQRYLFYDENGVLVGESHDVENSMGGYDTVSDWVMEMVEEETEEEKFPVKGMTPIHKKWMKSKGKRGKEVWEKRKAFHKEMRFNDTPAGYRHRDKVPGATNPNHWRNEKDCKFRSVRAKRDYEKEKNILRDGDYMAPIREEEEYKDFLEGEIYRVSANIHTLKEDVRSLQNEISYLEAYLASIM